MLGISIMIMMMMMICMSGIVSYSNMLKLASNNRLPSFFPYIGDIIIIHIIIILDRSRNTCPYYPSADCGSIT